MKVVKRDGSLEKLNIRKISDSISWACEGLNVSPSDIEMNLKLHLYDGIKTEDIHSKVIKTVSDMVTLRYPDYDKVAARLLMSDIYKKVYQDHKPARLLDTLSKFTYDKHYKKSLMIDYSVEEIIMLEKVIDYERNFTFSHIGLQYLVSKYMIDGVMEDPQVMFMAIAMDMFKDLKHNRMDYVTGMYEALSNFKVSLPTPMMKALRTESTDYASCVALKIGDSLDSWTRGFDAIVKHTAASAGIGVDVSSVASIGDVVKQGKIIHAGKIPLLKAVDAMIQVSTQNGRRGQAVAYVNFFDPEIVNILSLKSPRTDVAKRINDLKYAIKVNKLFYKRVQEDGYITLMSTRQFPILDSLFNSKLSDTDFIDAYETAEKKYPDLPKIKARELVNLIMTERYENGVYYFLNVDTANNDSSYLEPISQSNICMEFISPTKEVSNITEKMEEPAIGICILSNINQGTVNEDELEHYTHLLVYGLNQIMHRQNHPTVEANAFVRDYASLGIGFANHAYWLAKNGWKYGDVDALRALSDWVEKFQYGLIKASMEYAKQYDAKCKKFEQTTYSLGIMPQDRADKPDLTNKSVDWKWLSNQVKKYGMTNAALSMIPPSETSSVISNSTSGLEPIRDFITVKGSKTNPQIQLAPEALKLAAEYELAFERTDLTKRYLEHIAVVQYWIDQGISANTFYNPELYEDKKVPITVLIEDLFYARKLGIKTIYYNNVYVKDLMEEERTACSGEGCAV